MWHSTDFFVGGCVSASWFERLHKFSRENFSLIWRRHYCWWRAANLATIKSSENKDYVYLNHIIFVYFLSDCLWINIPTENISVTITVKGCKTLGCALWQRRDLYRATPAVTQGLGFSGLIQKTALIQSPFSNNQGSNKIANSILKQCYKICEIMVVAFNCQALGKKCECHRSFEWNQGLMSHGI